MMGNSAALIGAHVEKVYLISVCLLELRSSDLHPSVIGFYHFHTQKQKPHQPDRNVSG